MPCPRSRRSPPTLDRKGSIPPEIIAAWPSWGCSGCEHDFVAYVAGPDRNLERVGVARAPSSRSTTRWSAIRLRDSATPAQKQTYLSTADGSETARLLRVCRAVGRLRRGSDTNDRRRRRRRLRAEWPQTVRHERPPGAYRHHLCADRSRRRAATACRHSSSTPTHPGFPSATPTRCWGFAPARRLTCCCTTAACPKRNLLGGLNQGFAIARDGRRRRPHRHRRAGGRHRRRRAWSRALPRPKTASQFGRPIAEFEAIQWMVADMSTEIDAARLLTFRAAAMRARNPDDCRI